MMALYLLQFIVPLFLIGWLAFAPPRSVVGFWAQALAISIGLVAIGTTGIWAFPPWWTPYVYGVLLVAAALIVLVRLRGQPFWPTGLMGWLPLVMFAVLAIYSANLTRIALVATQAPKGRVIDVASPLGPGHYLVANGGGGPSVNAHATLLDQTIARHQPYWGTSHGVDLVALDRWGFRADGILPTDPASYAIFGRAVIAPCAGEVIAVVDGLPDLQVPKVDREHLAGNHAILRCSGVEILLGHFRNNSVRVSLGQRLGVGDVIAQVGNSGNTSEPHLHINAQESGTAKAPFSGAPIPIRINGRYLVRNDRFVVQERGGRP
jgi:Peptidase family M23